jgi:DNA-binding transcriptional ArsR family regulator
MQQPDRGEVGAGRPGTPDRPLRVTDPRKLRALAHPARIAILQHLVLEGPATATECADFAALSPSACSYHLRALAAHGFVEEDRAAAADGRQRPWRARVTAVTASDDPGQPAPVRAAARLLEDSLLARIEEIRAQHRERAADYPERWRRVGGVHEDVLHVTPDELEALNAELSKLLGRYHRIDRAERPLGARRVHVTTELIPWFDPADPS